MVGDAVWLVGEFDGDVGGCGQDAEGEGVVGGVVDVDAGEREVVVCVGVVVEGVVLVDEEGVEEGGEAGEVV